MLLFIIYELIIIIFHLQMTLPIFYISLTALPQEVVLVSDSLCQPLAFQCLS